MIFTFFTGFSRTFGLKSRTNHGFSREHMRADSRNLEQTRNVEQTRNLGQMAWQSSNVATLKKCLAYASLGPVCMFARARLHPMRGGDACHLH